MDSERKMTREEAMCYLHNPEDDDCYNAKETEAYNLAIKALKQEPCDDCISRQAVLDKIEEVCFSKEKEWVDFRVSQGSNGQRDLIINFIENFLPPVTPQPKTGHWIFIDKAKEHACCSVCGYGNVDLFDGRLHNYCENCGAKMEVEA